MRVGAITATVTARARRLTAAEALQFVLRGRAFISLILVVVVWLASGFYIVDEGRRGVETRFGKYTKTTQPGAQWHWPFPIEEKEIVDFSQVRTVEVGYRNTPKNKKENEALMLTDDENIIEIHCRARCRFGS